MPYQLQLLGSPLIKTPTKPVVPDRRMAGTLAYLALEGPTHKYKLAGYLWPDAEETTARNNMRQLLRRIRTNAGEIVVGEDLIELRPELEVDVKQLSYLETSSPETLKQGLELLAGLEYDDTYEFAEWLTGAREELRSLRSRSARSEAERLERLGNHKQALEFAQVWVRLEPLSEEAHRQVIRLHYLLGDRGAALNDFEALNNLLDKELGTSPLPETLELIRLIERGAQLQGARPKTKETVLPTAILRPPVLAGRQQEWALMEEAWQQGKLIFIVGDPGVGKSRLATDFLASQGHFIHLETRPGDSHVPYSFNNRFVRTALKQYQDYRLPDWARQTLAAWLPELGEASLVADPALQTRYFDAVAHVFEQIGLHGEAVFIDDLQFMDDSSARTGEYLLSSLLPLNQPSGLKGFVCCYRKGELSAVTEQIHMEMVARGMALRLFLEPIAADAVETLLEGLGLSNAQHLVPGLVRYTGGNPLFITETLKHLIETRSLAQGLPSRLAPPGKIATLIGQRLQRLSPKALNLARAAAVAGTSFDLNLAAAVLERPAMELAEAHAELESAQVVRGNAFTHDLVYEAVLANIPAAVKQVLHTVTARYLEGKEANPAQIAQHYEEAGDGDKTAYWLTKAAWTASALGLYTEEIELLERAIRLAVSKQFRLEAQVLLADALGPLGRVDESIELARSTLHEADDPKIKQRALSVLQNMLQGTGHYQEAQAFIEQSLELAEQNGEQDRANGMRFAKARVLRHLGHYAEAAELVEGIFAFYQSGPSRADWIQILVTLGNTYNLLGRHAEAEPLLQQAFDLRSEVGPAVHILAVSNLLYCLMCQEKQAEFFDEAESALGLGQYAIGDNLRNNLALAYLRVGLKEKASEHYRVLSEKTFDPNFKCIAWARLASLDAANSEAAINQAKELHSQAQTPAARFTLMQATILYGSQLQKSWGLDELETFDPTTLPWLFQAEYQELKQIANSVL